MTCYYLDPTPLDCTAGYIIEDAVGDSALKRLSQRRMNSIVGSISSYSSILNYPKRLDLNKQENKLTPVLGDIQYDHLGGK